MPELSYKVTIKTPSQIKLMEEGGKRLARIKTKLKESIEVGVSASEIELSATKLIEKEGGKPSFKMVQGYNWSTCINVNAGLVHGIPKSSIIFSPDDIVSVDVGLYFKGFHTDTSFTVYLGKDEKIVEFLAVGKEALRAAINKTRAGGRVYDLSKVMQDTIEKAKLTPIRALVGHGIGRQLHEEPQIPCFVYGEKINSPGLVEGMAIAIEVMYAKGNKAVELASDKWTITTSDGKISALFEETVLVTKKGPRVLTVLN